MSAVIATLGVATLGVTATALITHLRPRCPSTDQIRRRSVQLSATLSAVSLVAALSLHHIWLGWASTVLAITWASLSYHTARDRDDAWKATRDLAGLAKTLIAVQALGVSIDQALTIASRHMRHSRLGDILAQAATLHPNDTVDQLRELAARVPTPPMFTFTGTYIRAINHHATDQIDLIPESVLRPRGITYTRTLLLLPALACAVITTLI